MWFCETSLPSIATRACLAVGWTFLPMKPWRLLHGQESIEFPPKHHRGCWGQTNHPAPAAAFQWRGCCCTPWAPRCEGSLPEQSSEPPDRLQKPSFALLRWQKAPRAIIFLVWEWFSQAVVWWQSSGARGAAARLTTCSWGGWQLAVQIRVPAGLILCPHLGFYYIIS